MPSLVEHLFAVAAPSLSSPSGHTGGGATAPGPRSLYAPSLGVADDLVAMLAAWCDQLADDAGLLAPRPAGLWSVDVDDSGEVSAVAGVRDPSAARVLAGYLDNRLPVCAAAPWVGDLFEDLVPAVTRASAAYPVEEPDRRVRLVPCPRCGRRTLVFSPPRLVGAPVQVSCSSPSCGASLSEDDWRRARSWAVAAARMAAAGEDGVRP